MERTGSQLVLHICEELDHHTAGQISKVVDLQIEKGMSEHYHANSEHFHRCYA